MMTVAPKPAPPACMQTDDALRESHLFLRASLDALPGHIAVLDEAGVILEINAAWRRFADENKFSSVNYGVGSSYLLYCDQIFLQAINPKICHQTCAQTCGAGISAVISGQQDMFEMEYPFRSPTEERWFVMRVTRFQSPGPIRIVIVHDDCTERKRAEITLREIESFSRSIINSSPDCIKVLDLDGNLLSLLSGQALLGIADIRPFINKSWLDFWAGEDRVAAQCAVASAAAGIIDSTNNFVGFFRTLDGTPKWWDVAITPILGEDGTPARLLSVSRDVTQRKRAEMNLAFLAAISHDMVLWTNIDEMMQIVGAKLAAHFNLSSCAFMDIEEAAEQVVITHDWHRDDVPSLIGTHRLPDFVGDEFVRMARSGEAIVVRNTATDARTTDAKFAALQIASFICVPLICDQQWRFALCLYHAAPYDWREDEIELTRELTARIWTKLARLHSEAELRESEAQHRNLFNSMDEGLAVIEIIFDEHGAPLDYRFLEVNPAFSQHTGMYDAVGKRMRELVPNIESYWVEIYAKVALTGLPVRYMNTAKEMDGRCFDVYAFRVGDADRHQVAVLFTNITDRKKIEDALRVSEARFRALFHLGPVAMYSCDAAGKPIEHNQLAVALWGMEPKLGTADEQFQSLIKFYLSDGTLMAHADTPMSQVLSGQSDLVRDQQMIIERADGSRITVMTNIVPIKDESGEITGAISCFYDITERSLLAIKALEQTATLADLNRRKDEFLAMLSHELRNPLAPIANAVQLLRLQHNEDPLQSRAHGIIERQVGQLTRLVDDLLEVSRITTGRIHLREERLALSVIVAHAVETVRPLIDQRRHLLKLTLPPTPIWLFADAARLEQVLVNLLTNAVKYTDEGGTVFLSIAQEDDEAVIRVRDTGVGITPELLPRIFDLFTQADQSLDRSQGGLGIGLCLVRRLVEMHHGSVVAHSIWGQGSEFVVRLPVEKNSALSPGAASVEPQSSGVSLRVLVVDDNVDTASTLVTLLELSGHVARMAHDGLVALDMAIEFQPDVVILDIGLPGINGFEVAKRLRAAHPQTMLVAMTGYGEASARQRSREVGFDHHLVKPARFEAVEEILNKVKPAPRPSAT